MTRSVWLVLIACAGCHSFPAPALWERSPEAPVSSASGPPHAAKERAGIKGCAKNMTEPTAPEPELFLGRAASLAAQGEHEAAAEQLQHYVALRPEHLTARVQLGELFFRAGRPDEARLHFELFIALAQDHDEVARKQLIHCHSRLVEIAERQNDAYEEHLNRGIGLWLLAKRPSPSADLSPGLPSEALLYRAASELQAARAEQPDQARAHFYLYLVWKQLGQHTPALRSLEAADRHALLSRMTPRERRDLQTACVQEAERVRATH